MVFHKATVIFQGLCFVLFQLPAAPAKVPYYTYIIPGVFHCASVCFIWCRRAFPSPSIMEPTGIKQPFISWSAWWCWKVEFAFDIRNVARFFFLKRARKKIWVFLLLCVIMFQFSKRLWRTFFRAPRAGWGNDGPLGLNCILPASQVRGEILSGLLVPWKPLVKSPLNSHTSTPMEYLQGRLY